MLQASLDAPDLWVEAALLSKLVYKNSSQHRGTPYMRRLRQVLRELRLLEALQLPGCMDDLLCLVQLTAPGAAPPSAHIPRGAAGGCGAVG